MSYMLKTTNCTKKKKSHHALRLCPKMEVDFEIQVISDKTISTPVRPTWVEIGSGAHYLTQQKYM